jgi:hypothetical protein
MHGSLYILPTRFSSGMDFNIPDPWDPGYSASAPAKKVYRGCPYDIHQI